MTVEQQSGDRASDRRRSEAARAVAASGQETLAVDQRLALSERLERRRGMIDSSAASDFDDDDQTLGDLTEQELA